MSTLKIHAESIEDVERGALVHLDGVLDQPTLDTFLSELGTIHDHGNVNVILDMQSVSYANSTALGALVTQADAFREAGGALVLLNPQPKVNLVIEMLGLDAILPVLTSVDEARAHLAAIAPAAPPAAKVAVPDAGAAEPPSFPVRAECVGCGVLLEFGQPSHFRCPHCGAAYSVDAAGQISGSMPRGGHPIELSIPCYPQVLRAFTQFIGALPSWEGYSVAERARLESAIAEVCNAIHQRAYDGNDQASFHVLVVCRDAELTLRVADHGNRLDAADFPTAAKYMTDFEHRPHPARGNFLKMAKRPPGGGAARG